MVVDKSFQRILENGTCLESKFFGSLAKFSLIEPCDRSDEVDRQFRAVVEIDVSHEELCKTVDDEVMNFRDVTVPGAKRGK